MKTQQCAEIVQAMKNGGYYDAIMQGGPELDRVKAYFLAFTRGEEKPAIPLQYPDYPCFPGLDNLAFRSLDHIPGAATLEENFETIYSEWRALQDSAYLEYTPAAMTHSWTVHLFHYMGVDFEAVAPGCPKTHALIRSLPRVCLDYPWGDALFSVHARDSHLRAHCSVDNLRVRCHLGIQVPSGCEMRVGHERRTWQEGRALLFEDSFEHEVWNRGETKRAILILDFWHPDLTDIEIEALTAGFRKSDVRRLFALNRLQIAREVPESYTRHLEAQMASQENDPVLRRYWRS